VCCLWKEIKPSQAFHDVFPLFPSRHVLFRRPRHDLPNVPRLRMHITTHINDRLRAERKQLPHERLITSLTWRVNDERGPLRREVAYGAEDLRCVARAEGDFVCESVELRVVRCEADRVGGELDAGYFGEVWGKGECEEAGAAVGVYEVSWRWRGGCGRWHGWEDGVADVCGERDEDRVVILEERACLVVEEQLADAFPDGRFVICDADMTVFGFKLRGRCRRVATWYRERVTEQQGDAFFVCEYLSVSPIQYGEAWASSERLLCNIVAHWGISLIQDRGRNGTFL
jgi:hypothetical protein